MAQQAQVCIIVVKQSGKYLLVQEAKPKAYKLWNFPGGHVDPGETLEAAAIREMREETGYIVKILKQIQVSETHNGAIRAHAYAAKITGGELRLPVDEILDAKWFSPEEIMALENMRDREYHIQMLKTLHGDSRQVL
jgi:8-oxo-dGTP diphosphatase